MPCAASAGECNLIDGLQYDGRIAELKVKDAPSDEPLAIFPSIAQDLSIPFGPAVGWHPTRGPPPGYRTPLNILYCVYLD